MGGIVQGFPGGLDSTWNGHSTVPRGLARAVQREQGAALVANTRVQGRAYVTHTALFANGLLAAEEANLIQAAPLGEARYKLICDTYAIWCAGEVGRL